MRKTFTLLGASVVVFGFMNGASEARLVRYEINGKQYSYSTNNIAQTAEAKKRIAAAKAAEAAKSKADAEKSKNPLAAAFGSKAQKEAEETEKQLQQILADKTPADEAEKPAVKFSSERNVKIADKISDKTPEKPARQIIVTKPPPKAVAPILAQAVATPRIVPVVAEPLNTEAAAKLKSITFNVESGIRTIIKVDGTIEEEPFDSRVLSYLMPELENANSLVAFVKQLRRLSQEEATGSIRTSVAEPELARDR